MVQGINEEKGYTLVEVLIAITIVSIVLGIASTVFVFASAQLSKWRGSVDFYSTTQVVQAQLHKDVTRAEEVMVSDSSLTIILRGEEIIYHWADGAMSRNETELTRAEGDSLYLAAIQRDQGMLSWELVHKTFDRELRLVQKVSARNPVYWKPEREEW